MKKNQNHTQQVINFRKYSRKKYAAFHSLGKLIRISTISTACSLVASPLQAQAKSDSNNISTKIDLEEVEVVGQKATTLIDELPRNVESVDAQVINTSPSLSFQDLIQYNSNIDISQRGQFGIQSDISIRGGSFDQVLTLLNGINLTDPQTGHHSLNLPINKESIYKIEILNGAASRALGANAYSGAINIITKPLNHNQLEAYLNIGEYGYLSSNVVVNKTSKNTKNLLSASYSKSNGYTKNTDFNITNLFYHGSYQLNTSMLGNIQFGFQNKGFGANGYYTPQYPDQYEETSTFFFSAGIKSGNNIKNTSQISWRRHKDRYELFREDEDYYRYEDDGSVISNDTAFTAYPIGFYYINHHLTDIFGASHTSKVKSYLGTTSFGTNLRCENILSTSLGNELAIPIPIKDYDDEYTYQDTRNVFDIFIEHAYKSEHFFVSIGSMAQWNNFDPQKLNIIPGVDISYTPISFLSLVCSYNYAIGQPSFTDLSYQGPSSEGSKLLKPYSQNSYEAGIKIHSDNFHFKIISFYTNGKNNIDWVLDATDASSPTYKATNIALSENIGIESSTHFINLNKGLSHSLLSEFYLGYTFIDTYRSNSDSISKYSNLRNKIVLRINQYLFKNICLSWNFMYKQRIGNYRTYSFESNSYSLTPYSDAYIIDAKALYNIKNLSIYGEISNLLNCHYVESGSIEQPGRWLKAGISYKFKY